MRLTHIFYFCQLGSSLHSNCSSRDLINHLGLVPRWTRSVSKKMIVGDIALYCAL